MPYCPKCRSEYLDTAEVCCDCGAHLVLELAPPVLSEPGRLEVAYRGTSEIDLVRAQAFLESEGIPSLVHTLVPAPTAFDGVFKDPSGFWGEIRVPAEHAARACELLASLEPVPPEELPEAAEE